VVQELNLSGVSVEGKGRVVPSGFVLLLGVIVTLTQDAAEDKFNFGHLPSHRLITVMIPERQSIKNTVVETSRTAFCIKKELASKSRAKITTAIISIPITGTSSPSNRP
jgi:hypothetical protein